MVNWRTLYLLRVVFFDLSMCWLWLPSNQPKPILFLRKVLSYSSLWVIEAWRNSHCRLVLAITTTAFQIARKKMAVLVNRKVMQNNWLLMDTPDIAWPRNAEISRETRRFDCFRGVSPIWVLSRFVGIESSRWSNFAVRSSIIIRAWSIVREPVVRVVKVIFFFFFVLPPVESNFTSYCHGQSDFFIFSFKTDVTLCKLLST